MLTNFVSVNNSVIMPRRKMSNSLVMKALAINSNKIAVVKRITAIPAPVHLEESYYIWNER
jgi:hypothetical protein